MSRRSAHHATIAEHDTHDLVGGGHRRVSERDHRCDGAHPAVESPDEIADAQVLHCHVTGGRGDPRVAREADRAVEWTDAGAFGDIHLAEEVNVPFDLRAARLRRCRGRPAGRAVVERRHLRLRRRAKGEGRERERVQGLPVAVDRDGVHADALRDGGVGLRVLLNVGDLRLGKIVLVRACDGVEVRVAELDTPAGVHDPVLELRDAERDSRCRTRRDQTAAARGQDEHEREQPPHTYATPPGHVRFPLLFP